MAKSNPKTSPMMEQFAAAKAEHPDALLFFRMGDFYELFHEDAVTASRVLGLTLTSRSKDGEEKPIPMAGVPHHAADRYLKELIEAGYRVAVCDQMADPATVKGIVPREVTRLVTPGTLTDDAVLDPAAPNYLAAAAAGGRGLAGLACADLSTGEIWLEEVDAALLADALERIAPAETLLPEGVLGSGAGPFAMLQRRRIGLVTERPETDFSSRTALAAAREQYGVATLEGFGLCEESNAAGALGALLRYLAATQKGRVRHLKPPRRIEPDERLLLDRATIRNLELVEPMRGGNRKATLFGVLHRTATAAGSRLLRQWILHPLAKTEAIRVRQAAVGELLRDSFRRGELRVSLRPIADIERILGRLGCSRATPRDLAALGATAAALPGVEAALAGAQSVRLRELACPLGGFESLTQLLTEALVESPPLSLAEGGIFRTGYDAELDTLREVASGGKDWIARFQAAEVKRTGIASLKVRFNKIFGYYIEITKANLAQAPADYERKQTLVNAERFVTPELKEYEATVLGAEEKIVALERRLFAELHERVAGETMPLQAAAAALAEIDVAAALAEAGAAGNWVLPSIVEEPVLRVTDGRHPVLEAMLPAGEFVPNDTALESESSRVLIVTGPNMAGKSTYIRQCALLVILAQMGAPVPAARAEVGRADRVFTRVGASDDLARGHSTFMVEMSEAAYILNNATDRSFVVLDEIGRGTSTFDGVSLAWAITEYIHNRVGARCIFATHYHELAELGLILPGAANCNVAVRDWGGEVIFLHRIQPGSADKSYGIHVARLAGVPKPVIERAQAILEGLEAQEADRDRSYLGETEALRAAAREAQATLFDDPDRERLIADLARLAPERLPPERLAESVAALVARARSWLKG